MTDKTARNIAIVAVVAFLIVMAVMLSDVWGGTHSQQIPLMYGVVEPDSVLVRVKEIGSGTQVGDDTVITSFPDTLVYTIDSAKVYESQVFEAWYGASNYERPVTWVIPLRVVTATVDSTDVARYVWNTPQSSHTTSGTFGKYLDAEVSGIGGIGGGSDTLIYYAADTLNDNRIEGVQVTCYGIGGSQIGAKQVTNASGYNLWALNTNDTLIFIVYGPHLYHWELDTVVFTGQTTDSAMGYKTAAPGAAATAPYVKAYYDGGAGFVDSASGLMITRTNVTYYCQIIGAHAFADGSWGIVPQMQSKRPDANGRVTFLVVANLFLTPPTSYYRFWYEGRDGKTRVRRTIRNFVVDSIPDPVNILETIEVFPGNY